MMPFECYKTYIALKTHFTKGDKYDFIQNRTQRIRATKESFYGKGLKGDKDYRPARKDRFWFERMVRAYPDKDIVNFFVSNFVAGEDPQMVYMATIVKSGEKIFNEWKRKIQSLSYVFKNEATDLFEDKKFDDVFDCSKGHPPILKSHLAGRTSIESMVIYDRILGYRVNFDKKMDDVVWKSTSMKIKKYSPFLNIDVFHYKKILKDLVLDTAR